MMEHATANDRPSEVRGIPRELASWLENTGQTLAEWRQDQQRKQDPAVAALALRRRRLA